MKTPKTIRNMKRNFICILTGLILTGLLGMASISPAAGGAWEKKTDMPTPRHGFATAVVDGWIYTLGGRIGPEDGLQIVEAYDPVTNQWSRKADMPTGRRGAVAMVVDGKIYVIGGHIGPSSVPGEMAVVEMYDPATDTWTKKRDMPSARSFAAAEFMDGQIYVFGGWANSSPRSILEVYAPATDTWAAKKSMPLSTSHLGTGAITGKIYLVEGLWGNAGATYEYDAATDSWTQKTSMPTGRNTFATSVLDNKLYVIGGLNSSWVHLSAVERYEPATDTWTTLTEMPTARGGMGTAVVNGRIYIIGGAGAGIPGVDVANVLGLVEEHTPEGWKATSVSPQDKLATTWGEMKHGK